MKKHAVVLVPVRGLLEIVFGIFVSGFIMFMWYITQPITIKIIEVTWAFADSMGWNNTYVYTGMTILTYIEYYWAVVFLIAVGVVYMFVSSQQRTAESEWA